VYLDENGKEKPIIMGSYGIGPARIAAAAVEQNNDKDGIIWPQSIAPFDVEIIPLGADDEVLKTADVIYQDLAADGIEVLFDDRDERPGVKFKDAELIGIPCQIIIGNKGLKDGVVEFKVRSTKEAERIAPSDVLKHLRSI
jgi:prolyl-tRNA synthetase